jgi:hypothetical protein
MPMLNVQRLKTKTKRSIQLPLMLLVICLFLWGCATAVDLSGRDFDTSKAHLIFKGKTTADELLAMFGNLLSKVPNADGKENWTYYHVKNAVWETVNFFGSTSMTAIGGYENHL